MPSVEQRQKNTERVREWRAANPGRAAAVVRAHYHRDPAKQIARVAKWRVTNPGRAATIVRRLKHDKRAFLAEVVGAACVDCGDDRPGAVEYHHPGGKEKDCVPLANMGWEALKEEAMVLIAICGACHGVRHHKEES